MIHRIRIQNFKSLRDVTVELCPVTVLIGRSGTGKTNFASAIRYLRDYLSVPVPPPPNCLTNPLGTFECDVEFSVPGFDDRFAFSLQVSDRLLAERLRYGNKELFAQERAAWIVEPAVVPRLEPGAIAIRRLPGVEEVVVALAALTTGIAIYSFPQDVLTEPSDSNGHPGLADNAGNYLHVVRDIVSSLHDIRTRRGISTALRRVNETVTSVDLDSIQQPQTAIVGHRIGDKTLQLDLSQESDGFRRFYAHLLALYQTPPKQTLIFEEPENGIYPGALAMLADEFKTAPVSGRGQAILTTHSPGLLDHFSDDAIRVVELVDLETQIGPLAPEQRESLREQLLRPGELLTVDPARREVVPA